MLMRDHMTSSPHQRVHLGIECKANLKKLVAKAFRPNLLDCDGAAVGAQFRSKLHPTNPFKREGGGVGREPDEF